MEGLYDLPVVGVSIHAPAWGATGGLLCADSGIGVSIHAPAWGATRRPVAFPGGVWFQFTRPRGARQYMRAVSAGLSLFQFTRPRGARHYSRTSLGSEVLVSIHAPAWGATQLAGAKNAPGVFQFTRPRGARQAALIITYCDNLCFNSRARVGRDDTGRARCRRPMRFNSRARVGRDPSSSSTTGCP